MVNPNDNNKSKEAAKEEHLKDVSSEHEENMTITTSLVSSATSAPSIRCRQEDAHVADNQSGTEKKPKPNKPKKRLAVVGTSSNSTTLQIKKSKKKKGHILTIQLCQEDAPSNMADRSGRGGGKEVAKRGKRLAAKETYSSSSAPLKKPKKIPVWNGDSGRCLCLNISDRIK